MTQDQAKKLVRQIETMIDRCITVQREDLSQAGRDDAMNRLSNAKHDLTHLLMDVIGQNPKETNP